MKKSPNKLRLSRETLTALDSQLKGVTGGVPFSLLDQATCNTCQVTCATCYRTCYC